MEYLDIPRDVKMVGFEDAVSNRRLYASSRTSLQRARVVLVCCPAIIQNELHARSPASLELYSKCSLSFCQQTTLSSKRNPINSLPIYATAQFLQTDEVPTS